MTTVIIVGMVEAIVLLAGLAVFVSEDGRLPGTRRHWRPYVTGGTDHHGTPVVKVGVVRRSEHIRLAALDPRNEDFDQQLVEAEALARERCIQLESSRRAIARR